MNRIDNIKDSLNRVPWCVACNLALVYVAYMVCRLVFLYENYDMFHTDITWPVMLRVLRGGLLFDTSAIFYTNALYLLMVLLPLRCKERAAYRIATKTVFLVTNFAAIIANLGDTIYFPFSEKRSTILFFSEFGSNTNGASIFGIEVINHWYLVVLLIVLCLMLDKGYRQALWPADTTGRRYYLRQGLSLVVVGVLTVAGMRGAFFTKASRPIAMSNAYQYVDKPELTALVLNTPFSVIRTLTKHSEPIPRFFDSETEIEQYYTAVHLPDSAAAVNKRNVVILIVESLAEEFIGSRNRDLDGGTYCGYTPFVDSLITRSTTFEHTYANGWISIDAMPSVLSSVPKMYIPFVLSPYAVDDVPSLAKELGGWGYNSAFFHGAENSSMGFQAFARSAGFDRYLGRTEYCADPRFGGDNDFDGTWAIWDEEFLQFMCATLDEMAQPFLAAVFTATSHHPFALPDRYKEVYPEEGIYPIHKCIRYADNALRLFFESAARQPWYANTIFIITADHASSRVTHDLYRTAEGEFRVPIIIFDPSGSLEPGTRQGIVQQIDIMPTVLSLLGYDRPYVAFGKDALAGDPADTWAFNYHNIPQLMKGDYLLQYNGFAPSGIYNIRRDPLMRDNLLGTDRYDKAFVERMELELQAMLQEVDTRMKGDDMRYKPNQPQTVR